MVAIELMLGPEGAQLSGPGSLGAHTRTAVTADGGAAEAIAELLPQTLAQAGTPPRGGWQARVVLDDTLCWLDVVQGDFAGQPERSLQAVMQAAAAEILGESASLHTLRWQVQADGRHALLVAVPHALVQAVQRALEVQQVTLARLEPVFACAWNAAAGAVDLPDGVVAWLHAGRAIVVRMRRGSMAALGRERLDGSLTGLNRAVRRLLSRYGAFVDDETGRVLLTDAPMDTHRISPWRVHRVALPAARGA